MLKMDCTILSEFTQSPFKVCLAFRMTWPEFYPLTSTNSALGQSSFSQQGPDVMYKRTDLCNITGLQDLSNKRRKKRWHQWRSFF